MALTTVYLTGFEAGFASASGGSGITGGGGLGDIVTGAVSVISSDNRSGAYCLQCVPTGSAAAQVGFLDAGSTTARNAVRLAFKIPVLPASGSVVVARLRAAVATSKEFLILATFVDATHVKLQAQVTLGVAIDGPTIDNSGWHVLEMNAQAGASPWTLDWKVDGVAQTQASVVPGVANDTIARLYLGIGTTAGPACTLLYDDVIWGRSTTLEWYGDGFCERAPLSDGTHTFTSTHATKGDSSGGAAITAATTDAYTMENASPWTAARSTTVNIAQQTVANEYAEFVPTTGQSSGTANAVSVKAAYSAPASTAGATAGAIARNTGGTAFVIWGDFPTAQGGNNGAGAAYNVTANAFKHKTLAPSSSWTPTEVNAIRVRVGCSSGTHVPSWQGVLVEVDWPQPYAGDLGGLSADAQSSGSLVLAASLVLSSAGSGTGALELTASFIAVSLGTLSSAAQSQGTLTLAASFGSLTTAGASGASLSLLAARGLSLSVSAGQSTTAILRLPAFLGALASAGQSLTVLKLPIALDPVVAVSSATLVLHAYGSGPAVGTHPGLGGDLIRAVRGGQVFYGQPAGELLLGSSTRLGASTELGDVLMMALTAGPTGGVYDEAATGGVVL